MGLDAYQAIFRNNRPSSRHQKSIERYDFAMCTPWIQWWKATASALVWMVNSRTIDVTDQNRLVFASQCAHSGKAETHFKSHLDPICWFNGMSIVWGLVCVSLTHSPLPINLRTQCSVKTKNAHCLAHPHHPEVVTLGQTKGRKWQVKKHFKHPETFNWCFRFPPANRYRGMSNRFEFEKMSFVWIYAGWNFLGVFLFFLFFFFSIRSPFGPNCLVYFPIWLFNRKSDETYTNNIFLMKKSFGWLDTYSVSVYHWDECNGEENWRNGFY